VAGQYVAVALAHANQMPLVVKAPGYGNKIDASLIFDGVALPRDVRTARTLLSQGVHPSVRLFVCHTPVFYQNSKTYRQTFFTVG